MPTKFDGDDAAYLAWLDAHPGGFVVNARRRGDRDYLVLHRVTCSSISRYTQMAKRGGFTERGYVKVCAEGVEALRQWVRRSGRPDGTFSGACSLCKPL